MIELNNPKSISLVLMGQPVAKQSVRVAIKGTKLVLNKRTNKLKKVPKLRTHTAKKHVDKKEDYQAQIKQQLPRDWQPFKGLVVVERLVFVLQPPKAMLGSKKRQDLFNKGMVVPHYKKPDLTDNLPKLLFDSLTGLVYTDDSLICHERNIYKVYGLNPRIEITLSGEVEPVKGYRFIDLKEL